MKIVIHQPQLLPWIGFWHRLADADLYVAWSGVKFQQNGHLHRVTIDGEWLTCPVRGHQRTLTIAEVEMAHPAWQAETVHTLKRRFSREPYGHRLEPLYATLARLSAEGNVSVADMAFETLITTADILGIGCQMIFDEAVRTGDALGKLEFALDDHGLHGCTYLTAAAARNYIPGSGLNVAKHVRYQRLHPGADSDSVLQLIAVHPHPLAAIREAGTWEGYYDGSF